MLRLTLLKTIFTKKIEYHDAAFVLNSMKYNFARDHQSLSVTTTMEAGMSNHVWSLENIVNLISIKR